MVNVFGITSKLTNPISKLRALSDLFSRQSSNEEIVMDAFSASGVSQIIEDCITELNEIKAQLDQYKVEK